jgi:2-amino-4-hydroxy-6-hydroxymethyldihydropteridine diphosphokinase
MAREEPLSMILVAIGANLARAGGESPLETCRSAAVCLDQMADMRLCGLSRWYETDPMPPSGQPPYVNAVAHLAFTGVALDPASVLDRLMRIEARFERQRGEANAARTLDLDIIAIGDMVRDAPDPILPHPRAHLRGFVLLPLLDVAPGWVHPRLGETARALLARLPPQGVRLLQG